MLVVHVFQATTQNAHVPLPPACSSLDGVDSEMESSVSALAKTMDESVVKTSIIVRM